MHILLKNYNFIPLMFPKLIRACFGKPKSRQINPLIWSKFIFQHTGEFDGNLCYKIKTYS